MRTAPVFLILFCLLLTGCTKEKTEPFSDQELRELLEIDVHEPQEQQTYEKDLPININVSLKAPYEFHGLSIVIFDPVEQSILWGHSEHSHGTELEIEQTFTPQGFTGVLEMHIEAIIDHEDLNARRMITFHVE